MANRFRAAFDTQPQAPQANKHVHALIARGAASQTDRQYSQCGDDDCTRQQQLRSDYGPRERGNRDGREQARCKQQGDGGELEHRPSIPVPPGRWRRGRVTRKQKAGVTASCFPRLRPNPRRNEGWSAPCIQDFGWFLSEAVGASFVRNSAALSGLPKAS